MNRFFQIISVIIISVGLIIVYLLFRSHSFEIDNISLIDTVYAEEFLYVNPLQNKNINEFLFQGAYVASNKIEYVSNQIIQNQVTPTEIIKYYCNLYDVDYNLALKIAQCESGLNSLAKNPTSSASGIFQFIASTWARNCEGNVFNADNNISCAIRLLGEGGINHWNASRYCWK